VLYIENDHRLVPRLPGDSDVRLWDGHGRQEQEARDAAHAAVGRGRSPERAQRLLDIWREYASSIEAWDPLNRGHCMQEEMPEEIYGHFMKFLLREL
jgi:hypothetical protein